MTKPESIVYNALLEVNKVDDIKLVYDSENKYFKVYLSKKMIEDLHKDGIILIRSKDSKVGLMVREGYESKFEG